ncbi:MAG: zinc ribbon domain-containing protein, partial [Oscillospiraceae bacterium]|nr:zinc ribbon domain-containing protein [Oscillospiraceae bacterium]
IYIAMGKKCEEIYGSKNMPEFSGYMTEIADAKAQIAAAKAELGSLDTASVCPNCKKYVMENQKFCPYCGTKLIETVDAVCVDTDSQE